MCSTSWVQIWTLELGSGVRKWMGTSLSKNTSVIKFFEDPISFSRDTSEIAENCSILQCWRILQNSPGSGSRSRWVPKFNRFFPGLVPSCMWSLMKIALELWPVAYEEPNTQTNGTNQHDSCFRFIKLRLAINKEINNYKKSIIAWGLAEI